MTPEPQAPKEYIITHEHARKIWEHLRDNTHGNASWFWGEIEKCSRPHPAPAPMFDRQPCKYVAGDYCDTCKDTSCDFYLQAQIRKAREDFVTNSQMQLSIKKITKSFYYQGFPRILF